MLIGFLEFFLCNGVNPATRANYRRNKVSLSMNINNYQNLLRNKVGISIEEKKNLGEYHLEISLYQSTKVTTYKIGENFINPKNIYSKEEQEINKFQVQLTQDLSHYLDLIENKEILIQNKDKFLITIHQILTSKFIGNYKFITNKELALKLDEDLNSVIK